MLGILNSIMTGATSLSKAVGARKKPIDANAIVNAADSTLLTQEMQKKRKLLANNQPTGSLLTQGLK